MILTDYAIYIRALIPIKQFHKQKSLLNNPPNKINPYVMNTRYGHDHNIIPFLSLKLHYPNNIIIT